MRRYKDDNQLGEHEGERVINLEKLLEYGICTASAADISPCVGCPKITAEDWEILSDYGTHRICKNCGNVTVTQKIYGYDYECSDKKSQCRSGAVKPSHSCKYWEARINDRQ